MHNNALVKGSEHLPATTRQHWIKPRYRVHEHDHHYELLVDMPGVDKSGVELFCENNLLHVTGTRSGRPDESWRLVHREVPWHDYRLNLELNRHIEHERIEAKMADGVLRLKLPLREEAKPRTITVES